MLRTTFTHVVTIYQTHGVPFGSIFFCPCQRYFTTMLRTVCSIFQGRQTRPKSQNSLAQHSCGDDEPVSDTETRFCALDRSPDQVNSALTAIKNLASLIKRPRRTPPFAGIQHRQKPDAPAWPFIAICHRPEQAGAAGRVKPQPRNPHQPRVEVFAYEAQHGRRIVRR